MQHKVPVNEEEAAISGKVMKLLKDLCRNLKEFQEAVQYCLYYMIVSTSDYAVPKEMANAAFYLRELSLQLHLLDEAIE